MYSKLFGREYKVLFHREIEPEHVLYNFIGEVFTDQFETLYKEFGKTEDETENKIIYNSEFHEDLTFFVLSLSHAICMDLTLEIIESEIYCHDTNQYTYPWPPFILN